MRDKFENDGFRPAICNTCQGWGQVYHSVAFGPHQGEKRLVVCPECRGEKVILQKTTISTIKLHEHFKIETK